MANRPTIASLQEENGELKFENRDLRNQLEKFQSSEYQPILRTDRVFLEERVKRLEKENEELGIKAAQEMTKAAEKIDILHSEKKNLAEDKELLLASLKKTADENEELKAYINTPRETDKECGMAEQSPEAKAYEDIHTRRMEAELKSIELDNERKRMANRFRNDYPEGVWEIHSEHLNTLDSSQSKTWFAIIALGVILGANEVIQWVTLLTNH